jgi:hypothetical protein
MTVKTRLLSVGLLLVSLTVIAPAGTFTNEAAWRAAAGAFALENFDGFAAGTDLASLAALSIKFDFLSDLTHHPSVQSAASAFGGNTHSAPNALFNAFQAVLPGLGPIVIRPLNPGQSITALGYWNTGEDDSTVLSFFDAGNNLLESIDTGTNANVFVGIVNVTGAAKVVISAGSLGNGFFSIDDLQTNVGGAVAGVPEPQAFWLLGGGLAFIAAARKFRLARR